MQREGPSVTKTRSKGRRVLLIILAAAAVLLIAALLVVSNLLFSFALDPNASFTMNGLLRTDQAEGIEADPTQEGETEAGRRWQEYYVRADQWFTAEGEEAALTSHDGLALKAHRFARADSHRWAIVCHGYGGYSRQMSGYAMAFYDMGCSVLVPDARAHGESGGEYIGMGWPERKDLLGWIGQIVDADPQAEILLFGISMGGATVMMTAGEELPDQVKCIVEDCGYTSVWDEFSVQLENMFSLPEFPLLYTADLVCRLRAGYGFKEASAVKQLEKARVPMLFIHGEEDTFVPYAMLAQVYAACASPEKELLSVPGAPHGAAAATDPALYWGAVETFAEKHLS